MKCSVAVGRPFSARSSQPFASEEYARALKEREMSLWEDTMVAHFASAAGLSRGAPNPVHCLVISSIGVPEQFSYGHGNAYLIPSSRSASP